MPIMDVKVYYLEMRAPAARSAPAPREGLAIVQAKRPTIGYYRFLYRSVGQDYNWRSRAKLSDDALAALIQDPRDEVHVLSVEGTPAGFAELDRRVANQVELVQFGLVPEFIGQGFGKYFLQWTIDRAWSYAPERFWLHTCTLDHPAALPNYLKRGFRVYREEWIKQEVADRDG